MFVADIDRDALAVTEREIPGVQTAVCDMASRAEIERMVPAAVAALGGLDVLVNNAGIAGPTAPVEEFDPDAWDRVVQINLTGTFNVTRLAIPHLAIPGRFDHRDVVGGRPVRLSQPQRLFRDQWGLIGFTKTLSRELGEFGIRANAILPGAVDGARLQGVYQARAEKTGQPLDKVKAAAMALQSLPVDNDMQSAS